LVANRLYPGDDLGVSVLRLKSLVSEDGGLGLVSRIRVSGASLLVMYRSTRQYNLAANITSSCNEAMMRRRKAASLLLIIRKKNISQLQPILVLLTWGIAMKKNNCFKQSCN